MRTLPLSEVKAHLSELVEDAARTHERVSITRHGRAAAILLAADDYESLLETLFWAGRPYLDQALAEGDAVAAAVVADEDDDPGELRAAVARRPDARM